MPIFPVNARESQPVRPKHTSFLPSLAPVTGSAYHSPHSHSRSQSPPPGYSFGPFSSNEDINTISAAVIASQQHTFGRDLRSKRDSLRLPIMTRPAKDYKEEGRGLTSSVKWDEVSRTVSRTPLIIPPLPTRSSRRPSISSNGTNSIKTSTAGSHTSQDMSVHERIPAGHPFLKSLSPTRESFQMKALAPAPTGDLQYHSPRHLPTPDSTLVDLGETDKSKTKEWSPTKAWRERRRVSKATSMQPLYVPPTSLSLAQQPKPSPPIPKRTSSFSDPTVKPIPVTPFPPVPSTLHHDHHDKQLLTALSKSLHREYAVLGMEMRSSGHVVSDDKRDMATSVFAI